MRYTKKEIELSKEIAKYYNKKIQPGDWIYWKDNKHMEVTLVDDIWLKMRDGKLSVPSHSLDEPHIIENYFPLWTFKDAREWLRKRGWRLNRHYDGWSCEKRLIPKQPDIVALKFWSYKNDLLPEIKGQGKTDLEAILKVVLAVLKRERKSE